MASFTGQQWLRKVHAGQTFKRPAAPNAGRLFCLWHGYSGRAESLDNSEPCCHGVSKPRKSDSWYCSRR